MLGDLAGQRVALAPAEITVRRHGLPVLAECPAPGLSPELTEELRLAALRLAHALALTGVAAVEARVVVASGGFSLAGVRAVPYAEHALEAVVGVDLTRLRLALARGRALGDEGAAPVHGHGLAARLTSEDPQRDGERSAGAVEVCRPPLGPGLRLVAAVVEGDELAVAGDDPTLATLVAWAGHRREALARLGGGLRELDLLVRGGATNKACLLALHARAELTALEFSDEWFDAVLARGGCLDDAHADVALIAVAIAAYQQAQEREAEHFFRSARHGRPRLGPSAGRRISLRHQDATTSVLVAQLSAQTYRLEAGGGASCDVRVEPLGRHEHRLSLGEHRHRVRLAAHGLRYSVEVDGLPRHVLVEDTLDVVRSPSPAVVLRLPVAVGAEVLAGQPVIVLEAMKMEITVEAVSAGRVREVLVTPSAQVELDAPLLVIERGAAETAALPRHQLALPATAPAADAHQRFRRAFAELRRLLLGYDADAGTARAIAAEWKAASAQLPAGDPELARAETSALQIFADLHSLLRRQPAEPQGQDDDRAFASAQEHLLTFLRAGAGGLPASFLRLLGRALAHYTDAAPAGDLPADSPAVRDALQRIFRAHERGEEQALVIAAILDRRLAAGSSAQAPVAAGDALHVALNHLISASRRRFEAVHELALEIRHALFDEPGFARAREEIYRQALTCLERLEGSPAPAQRAAAVADLVDTPQPLSALLSWRMTHAEASLDARAALLEALTRRHYRTRELQALAVHPLDGAHYARAHYLSGARQVTVISSYVPRAQLAAAVQRLAPVLRQAGPPQDVVLDLYTTTDEPLLAPDDDAAAARAALVAGGLPAGLCRVVVSTAGASASAAPIRCVTFHGADGEYREDKLVRGLHPMIGRRMSLWRLAGFELERLPSVEDLVLYRGVAKDNRKDERLFAMAEVRDSTAVRDAEGHIVQLPYLERVLGESLAALRRVQADRPARDRLHWNRVILQFWQPLTLSAAELDEVVRHLAPATEGLGIEQVMVYARIPDPGGAPGAGDALREVVLRISNTLDGGLHVRVSEPPSYPLATLTEYEQKVISLRRRGLIYPYEIVRLLTPATADGAGGFPRGDFVEHDLDEGGALVPVARPWGQSSANIITGVLRSFTVEVPEGMERVVLLGDASKEMGSLAEPECRRIIAALDLAEQRQIPLEWYALSAGAKISRQSGTENMDWISAVLRRIIEYTQRRGELNVVVCGINVGAQPYWNAEATMLMHTRGVLIMIGDSAMVLTGKQALDYSGSTSAEDNQGIGGYERIMGPNGQAQYWAPDVAHACKLLLRHYAHCYVVPGERFPRPARTVDPRDRDVRPSPHPGAELPTIGDVFGPRNADRKRPFDIRAVMRAIADFDHEPLERWRDLRDGEIGVIWDAHLAGVPVCMIGIESHALPRRGFVPGDGPVQWTSGTLFPRSSKKIARAVNAASGNRPLVVIANLAGFDGSPESMRELQLEYGAEIGRAVVNFDGPIVFCVVSRYHGGAFVVFSKKLNQDMEVIAVEGARASVIGGAPAAAVVFARDVDTRTAADPRLTALEAALAAAAPADKAALRRQLAELRPLVRSEKLGEVADEFDQIHSVERALRMGSIDRIVPAAELRPALIAALERGVARVAARWRSTSAGPTE